MWLETFQKVTLSTVRDIVPIAVVLLVFQLFVLRARIANPRRLAMGLIFVVAGLALFLQGLEQALFPLGRVMVEQLTDGILRAAGSSQAATLHWTDYAWVYAFGAAIGFATTLAEPALIAVALKAKEASGGTVSVWGLRIAVALGVAVGVGLGTFRIVTGAPLQYFIIFGYVVVIVQTFLAPRMIIPLAYDSGGVTTSTVTVPLVTALGLELAARVPGRSQLLDGFGLIAFASLFPIIAVLGYAQLAVWWAKTANHQRED